MAKSDDVCLFCNKLLRATGRMSYGASEDGPFMCAPCIDTCSIFVLRESDRRRFRELAREWAKQAETIFCADCGEDTDEIDEGYFVNDDVWAQSGGGRKVLCIGCLEKRIGRRLNSRDFPPDFSPRAKSRRLRSRLIGGGHPAKPVKATGKSWRPARDR